MRIGNQQIEDALVCEGIIGDGCGGGRIFYIKEGLLYAYDPYTQTQIVLLKEIQGALSLKKKGCLISIDCKKERLLFDLSKMQHLA